MCWKALLPPVLILAGALLAAGQPPEREAGKPEPPTRPPDVVNERALPDLTVTQFAVTGPATKTYPYGGPFASSPGYVFVPVDFTVTNIGKVRAGPFKIEMQCRVGTVVKRATFMDYTGTQDRDGGGWTMLISQALGPPGVFLQVPYPLPAGGKVKAVATAAIPIGNSREDLVPLWVVADCANEVRESNENNNDSQPIKVKMP